MNDQEMMDREVTAAPAVQPAKGLALASFLCGLGSVVCCMGVPASVVGLSLGHVAKKKGNRSGLRKVGTVFCIAGIVFHVLLMVFAGTVMPDILDEIAPELFGDGTVESVTNSSVHIPEENITNPPAETTRELSVSEMLVYTANGDGTYAVSVMDGATLPETVVIPAHYKSGTVTSIADTGFSDQRKLTSLTIPDTVTSIGNRAFSGCRKLMDIRFSVNLKTLGEGAFFNCDALRRVTLPEGVTSIGYECFAGCDTLFSVDLPNSLTQMGDAAFRNCPQFFPSFPLPAGLTSIPASTYQGCTFPDFMLTMEISHIGSFAFNGETINVILYPGTIEDWKTKVTLDENWMETPESGEYNVRVICDNGTVLYRNEQATS
ncbi:MAG: leucine-rich repeat protein [Clostridia bacterium]|nr:leucine-rich repeat protein [Clostridia bacterium]